MDNQFEDLNKCLDIIDSYKLIYNLSSREENKTYKQLNSISSTILAVQRDIYLKDVNTFIQELLLHIKQIVNNNKILNNYLDKYVILKLNGNSLRLMDNIELINLKNQENYFDKLQKLYNQKENIKIKITNTIIEFIDNLNYLEDACEQISNFYKQQDFIVAPDKINISIIFNGSIHLEIKYFDKEMFSKIFDIKDFNKTIIDDFKKDAIFSKTFFENTIADFDSRELDLKFKQTLDKLKTTKKNLSNYKTLLLINHIEKYLDNN